MKLLKRIENIFSAVAFAEAGEHETARRILKDDERQRAAERKKEEGTEAQGKHGRTSPSPSRV